MGWIRECVGYSTYTLIFIPHSSNTKRKLNVYQTFGKHPGHLLNVSCSILRAVFRECITPNSYLFEFNNRDSRETCSKLTKKTPEWRYWLSVKKRHWRLERSQKDVIYVLTCWRHCRAGVFTTHFDHISHLFLLFFIVNLGRECIYQITYFTELIQKIAFDIKQMIFSYFSEMMYFSWDIYSFTILLVPLSLKMTA